MSGYSCRAPTARNCWACSADTARATTGNGRGAVCDPIAPLSVADDARQRWPAVLRTSQRGGSSRGSRLALPKQLRAERRRDYRGSPGASIWQAGSRSFARRARVHGGKVAERMSPSAERTARWTGRARDSRRHSADAFSATPGSSRPPSVRKSSAARSTSERTASRSASGIACSTIAIPPANSVTNRQ
jgi:hypothetical protein